MRNFFRFILPVLIPVLAIVLVMVVSAVNKGKRPDKNDDTDQAMLVEVMPIESESLVFTVESQGTVKPRTETTLVAEVSGKVTSVSSNYVAGGFFRKGDILLQIDPSDYETAVKRAEANLAGREAQLAQEEARVEQAVRDWRNLGRESTPSDLVLRKPQQAEAQANVDAAEADLQKAERDLYRTRIRVPYDGLVKEKAADIGQFVSPGTRLGVTFAIDSAEIRLPLASSDLMFLNLPSATGSETTNLPTVILRASSGNITHEWTGRIIRTEGVVDERSRVIYAVAEVEDPYGVLGETRTTPLAVGTFVHGTIDGISGENLTVFPRHVLRSDNTVLVADSEKKLQVRSVGVVRSTPESVYIDSGIEAGDRVITTAIDAAIPGTELAISGEEEPPVDDSGDAADSLLATAETE
jgi:RND family efflux transporter MFP subunit